MWVHILRIEPIQSSDKLHRIDLMNQYEVKNDSFNSIGIEGGCLVFLRKRKNEFNFYLFLTISQSGAWPVRTLNYIIKF